LTWKDRAEARRAARPLRRTGRQAAQAAGWLFVSPRAAFERPPETGRIRKAFFFQLAPGFGTPDPTFPNFSGAVREWCVNTAAVDPITKSVLVNSEDGKLYRWDLTANSLSQVLTLSSGIGEAYTPTLIGTDGTAFAINDAVLFALGR
jgi:hypothetical protein